jgi:predicted ABC-type ATPase
VKKYEIFAGVNGAGKSTLYETKRGCISNQGLF